MRTQKEIEQNIKRLKELLALVKRATEVTNKLLALEESILENIPGDNGTVKSQTWNYIEDEIMAREGRFNIRRNNNVE